MRTLIESSSGRRRTTVERDSGSKVSTGTGVFCWNPDHFAGSSIALLAV